MTMGPNWLQYLVQALSTVPYIVAGIEHIHGSAISGASKKELAMQAIGLSSVIAPVIDPAHAATIAAASHLASSTIDGVVAVMNAAKEKPQQIKIPASVPSVAGGGTSTAPAPTEVPSVSSEQHGGSAAVSIFP
jgi:hypothetical protein